MFNKTNLPKADPLETLLYQPKECDGTNLADALLHRIWKTDSAHVAADHKTPFLEAYEAHTYLLDRTQIPINNHRQIVDLVDYILARKDSDITSIKHDLRLLPWLGSSSSAPTVALDLTSELLMVGREPECWRDDDTLVTNIAQTFRGPSLSLASNDLGIDFNFEDLERILGIRIIKTDSLPDHLLFDQSKRLLWVFSQDAFLKYYSNVGDREIFPSGLLKETLKTLQLLYSAGVFDLELGVVAERDLHQYFFWRDRLIMLRSSIGALSPLGLKQWWYDRRNFSQWITIWLGISAIFLTVLFGLIQSITGILQVTSSH